MTNDGYASGTAGCGRKAAAGLLRQTRLDGHFRLGPGGSEMRPFGAGTRFDSGVRWARGRRERRGRN